MPSVRSRKNATRQTAPKMQAWGVKGLFDKVSSALFKFGEVLKYEFKAGYEHESVVREFNVYFTNVTPMFELNSTDTIRLVDYPTDYKSFLESAILREDPQNIKMFNDAVKNLGPETIYPEDLKGLKGFLSSFNNLKVIAINSKDSENDKYTYYTLNVGVINEACKRRFDILMSARYNLMAETFHKVSDKISEQEFRSYEKELRQNDLSPLKSTLVDWKRFESLRLTNKLLELNSVETKLLKEIASVYGNEINVIRQPKEIVKNKFFEVVRGMVEAKDSRYLKYFEAITSGIYISEYKLKENEKQYLDEVVRFICTEAAIKFVYENSISLVSYIGIGHVKDLSILGLEEDFARKRYININNLGETYKRNAKVVVIANALMIYLKMTPKELENVNGGPDSIVFSNTWNKCEILISDKISQYDLQSNLYKFFNQISYNLPIFLVDFLRAAIRLSKIKKLETGFTTPKSSGVVKPSPTPAIAATPVPTPTPAIAATPVPTPVPAPAVVDEIFYDFFVKGLDTKRIVNISTQTFRDIMDDPYQTRYPRIVVLWYRWVRGTGNMLLDYKQGKTKEYILVGRMISNMSKAAIFNDSRYEDENEQMLQALRSAGSKFFESYSPDEVRIALNELRLSIFNNIPLDREMVLWRGLKFMTDEDFNDLCTNIAVGQIKHFTRFSACSKNVNLSESFSFGGNSMLLRIIIPRGMKVINLNCIQHHAFNEDEILLPDNTFFYVENIETYNTLRQSCNKVITLRVISQWNPMTGRLEPQINIRRENISVL